MHVKLALTSLLSPVVCQLNMTGRWFSWFANDAGDWLFVEGGGGDLPSLISPFKTGLSSFGRSLMQLSTNTTNTCYLYGPQILIGLFYSLWLKCGGCLLIAVV